MGKNKKNILILTEDPGALHLSDASFQLLQGILSACKLDMDDVVLFNVHQKKLIEFEELKNEFHPRCIIAFGIESENIPLPENNYEIKSDEEAAILSAPALSIISVKPDEKKKLWAVLKILFSL